jgi:DNA polymerase
MALRFSGAHTHRLSGDWKLNMQNLPSRGNNRIRSAIKAPSGYKVIAPDASQIEARLAAWFCGAQSMVTAFANGEDIYSSFATEVFGYEVKKETHKVERFIGKTAVLGLQYGLGWEKFQKTVALQSKAQVGKEVKLSDEEAAKVVKVYRTKYAEIPRMWNRLNNLIPRMTSRDLSELVHPVQFMHEKVQLPSGLYLHYHDLQNKNGQWWFTYGGKPKYLYGGKLLENIVQALARICVMDTAVAVRRMLSEVEYLEAWLNLQVHDELVYIAKERDAAKLLKVVIETMSTPPKWGPDIPLKAEGDMGDSYGDCK